MSKTVYILGAGFSANAKAPLQREILKAIFIYRKKRFSNDYEKSFLKHRKSLIKFLITFFNAEKKDLFKIQLEDIFTLLDKSIIQNESLKGLDIVKLNTIRNSLNNCIAFIFDDKLNKVKDKFYKKLAEKIIKDRIEAGFNSDPFCFIYLNWDIVLDNKIFLACRQYNRDAHDVLFGGKKKIGIVKDKRISMDCHIDYCCYTNPIGIKGYRQNSINVKARKKYNIKIQKLHGSLNWLMCNNCGRLFVKYDEKIARNMLIEGKNKCPKCLKHSLVSYIIAPTLIKDLNNTHLKMVWHNAFIDLSEADRIVFIGYSLPDADFEFRYLLKRSIKPNARIQVVLKRNDKKIFENYKNLFGNQFRYSGRITIGAKEFLKKKFKL